MGAEKALFRALKTKGNTPKYGLIFASSFIGQAAAKNKGRISRYLANKCSIASRIDSFSDRITSKFGEKLHQQVNDRLAFFESGEPPKRNADVMGSLVKELDWNAKGEDQGEKKSKKSKKEKKRKHEEVEEEEEEAPVEEEETKKSKKSKKSKKEEQE